MAAAVVVFEVSPGSTNAVVTLCVHAGIAASDAICCSRLGYHAKGDDHAQAKSVLAKVDRDAAKDLGVLLALKTPAGYEAKDMSRDDATRARRAAARLVAMAAMEATS